MHKMQMFPAQQLQRKQSLVITTQLQQAIRLLTMSNIELGRFLEQQSEDNPFLDISTNSSDTEDHIPLSQATPENQNVKNTLDFSDGTIQSDGPIPEAALDNQFETGRIELGRNEHHRAGNDSEFDTLSLLTADADLSLYAHACAEAERLFSEPTDRMIALAIIDALEPSGWLGQDIADIAAFSLVTTQQVETVLTQLQEIEPAGLFARDFKECLRLQARDRDLLSISQSILKGFLRLI